MTPFGCDRCGRPFSRGLSGCVVNGDRYEHHPNCPGDALWREAKRVDSWEPSDTDEGEHIREGLRQAREHGFDPKGTMTTDRMTREQAEELVRTPQQLLSPIDQQRQYLAKIHLRPVPCPNCEDPLPEVLAIHRGGDDYECPHCHALLHYTVPVVSMAGEMYFWKLKPHQIKAS